MADEKKDKFPDVYFIEENASKEEKQIACKVLDKYIKDYE